MAVLLDCFVQVLCYVSNAQKSNYQLPPSNKHRICEAGKLTCLGHAQHPLDFFVSPS